MPEMDGLETLRELKRAWPRLRVVLFSTYTRHGAKATLDALWLGADDYATKVSASDLVTASRCVQSELIPKIKALCPPMDDVAASNPSAEPLVPAGPPPTARQALPMRAEIVAIAASTGGPRAL